MRRFGFAFLVLSCICGCDLGARPADRDVNFASAAAKPNASPADDMPVPPKDAQYTICCRDFAEPTHVQDSRDAQSVLAQTGSMKKWYVVHASDHSTLYYGFYRSIDPRDTKDGAEGRRAIDDLNTIRQMQDSQGNRLFPASLPVGIDAPDPQANPAWDITRAPGEYSIEIACYTNTADRKQNAVDSVREARRQGIEAYYYHGPAGSSVCIGCWPAEAVVEVDTDVQNTDPDKPLYVTPRPLDPEAADRLKKATDLTPIAPHVDIVDPTLLQALRKWREHSVNGQTRVMLDPATGQTAKQVERAFLFKIPHKDPLDTLGTPETATVTPAPKNPDQAPPGAGQLRSLGD